MLEDFIIRENIDYRKALRRQRDQVTESVGRGADDDQERDFFFLSFSETHGLMKFGLCVGCFLKVIPQYSLYPRQPSQ